MAKYADERCRKDAQEQHGDANLGLVIRTRHNAA
jgi:hypothetical protein